MKYLLLYIGTINSTVVHPREIFKEAYMRSASSIVVLHNHPSGNVEPSRNDINITTKLKRSCEMLDIPLLDHIIVSSSEKYYSFKEHDNLLK